MNTKWLKLNLTKNKSNLDITKLVKGFRYSNKKLEIKMENKKRKNLTK